MTDQRKKIIAVSKETYKGVSLFETNHGTVAFYLGTVTCEAVNIDTAKLVIDDWFRLKVN